jgi:hypothetical protein
MKRKKFLLISALLSFGFGSMLFFLPQFASKNFGMTYTPEIGSLLRGMGGLIIGTGLINFLFRKTTSSEALKALFIANIVTQFLGIIADFLGLYEEVLTLRNILPVQVTHLFIGVGSLIYLLQLEKQEQ